MVSAPPIACRYFPRIWSALAAGSVRFLVGHLFSRSYPSFVFADRWYCHRFARAPVTCEAGHGLLTVEAIVIDRKHHLHHLARGLLGVLVILF
jgi:hypothetical protein